MNRGPTHHYNYSLMLHGKHQHVIHRVREILARYCKTVTLLPVQCCVCCNTVAVIIDRLIL